LPVNAKAAISNYVALSSSHYNSNGVPGADGGAVDGDPSWLYPSGPPDNQRQGNGVIVFAGPLQGDRKTVRGVDFASIRDGASNTIMFGETREETWNAWASAFSTYVVAVPRYPAPPLVQQCVSKRRIGDSTSGLEVLTHRDASGNIVGEHSINKGSEVERNGGQQAPAHFWYARTWPHQNRIGRIWGPSSAHPGVVQFGYGDGHGEAIEESIDPDVFLHRVTRAGGEFAR
jgi:hypothetical protein